MYPKLLANVYDPYHKHLVSICSIVFVCVVNNIQPSVVRYPYSNKNMVTIFCPMLVVHINSCLRLKFFPYLNPSPLPLLFSPRLPHLSSSMLLSPSLPHPPLISLPHLSLSLLLPPLPHLSLFCPPSPFLLPHSLTFHPPYLPLPPSPRGRSEGARGRYGVHTPSSSLTSPSPSLLQLSCSSSFLIDYVNLVLVAVGPVCDAVYLYAV